MNGVGGGNWQLMCSTSEEWKEFAKRFEGSQNAEEQKLHQLLVSDILPAVLPELQVTPALDCLPLTVICLPHLILFRLS